MELDFLYDGIVILDGAMGTVLQQRGLPPGGKPDLLNLTGPDLLYAIYREYIEAGSQIICANTFGASAPKLAGTGRTVDEVVSAAVAIAKDAAAGTDVKVTLDMGPLGELLEPLGTLPFERAYAYFKEVAIAGEKAGADLVSIETMTDLYEAKAALLAVKENTSLPVLVTMSFEQTGRTFTGCTIPSMARTLEGLGADAIGLNCSLGPDLLAPLLKELCENTRLPVIAKPNAGLPDPATGKYNMGPEEFVKSLLPCLDVGVTIFGGCCGTSPDYIRRLRAALAGKGRQNTAFIVDRPTPSNQLKQAGYEEGVAACCGGRAPVVIHSGPATGDIYHATQELLRTHPDTNSIIYSEDLLAVIGIRALLEMGVCIPDDVAVIGINNSRYTELCTPTLTSLDNMLYDLSLTIVEDVSSVLQGKYISKKVMIYSKIVERQST